jgi:hypothetical protein
MMDMQNPNIEGWEGKVGERVVCPKCGKEGIVGVDSFKAKGKGYAYLVVRHYEHSRTRRCVIKRAEEHAKHAKPAEVYSEVELP